MFDRIAIFGGTFDPPHISHVLACHHALMSGEIDKIIMVPVYLHANKFSNKESFANRLEMCKRAVEFLGDKVIVSDIESKRQEVSLTINTIRAIKEIYPNNPLRFLVGSDISDDIKNWEEGETILKLAPPMILLRATKDKDGMLPDVSSTFVKDTMRSKGDLKGILPHAVIEYIKENNLYGDYL